MNGDMKNLVFSLGLVFLAVGERLWFDLGPNVELIMTTSIIASIYLGRRWGIVVAWLSLMISDAVIGNTLIMVFTWSAFGLIAWVGKWLKNKSGVFAVGYGLAAALFFYFYTNFGVWLISGMYSHNLSGLIECYIMGLPFLKLHAVSSALLLTGGLTALKWFGQLRWKPGTVPQL